MRHLALLPLCAALSASGCSGAQMPPETVRALERLPEALEQADQALAALRTVLQDHREADEALGHLEAVLDLGQEIARGAAAAKGPLGWASMVLRALAVVLGIAKGAGADVPDAVSIAAERALALLPEPGGG